MKMLIILPLFVLACFTLQVSATISLSSADGKLDEAVNLNKSTENSTTALNQVDDIIDACDDVISTPRAIDYIKSYGCFVAGTKISLNNQFIPIENVKVNDKAWTCDTQSKEKSLQTVTKTFVREVDTLVYVWLNKELIQTTAEHPFFTPGLWKPALSLKEGDEILTYQGTWIKVDSIAIKDTTCTVYNFEVEGNHNYYVGNTGVLVHNTCDLNDYFNKLGFQGESLKAVQDLFKNFDFRKIYDQLGATLKEQFLTDFKGATESLKKFEVKPGLVYSWKLTREAIGNTTKGGFTQFALDIPTLQSVNRMSAPNSAFRQAAGNDWESILKDIINKAKVSPCSSCGIATGRSIGRTNMNEYLDNVDYFVQHGDINSKGKTLYNWIRNGATENQLDELHQTLEVFKRDGLKSADIEGLGMQFPRVGTNGVKKKYDIRKIDDIYHELKNKSFTKGGSIPTDDVNQVIDGYFQNINNLDDFVWEAKYAKLESWGSKADVLAELKKQWKTTLTNKADYMINGLGVDKMKALFGSDVVSPAVFKAKLNNESFLNNALRFLKVD